MKNNIIFLFFLAKSIFVFSQIAEVGGRVEYMTSLSLGVPVSSNSTMFFSSTNSKFIQGEYGLKNNDLEMKILEIESTNDSDVIFVDLIKKELVNKTSLGDEPYFVKEKLSSNWTLFSETKKILDYTCLKATGNFRGRHYTVWYTMGIPVNFGPWKLNSLPGLILEAKDDSGSVAFLATKIYLENSKKKDDNFYRYVSNDNPTVELKDFVKQKQEYEKEEIKKIMSRFTKGMAISSFSESDKNSNLEVTYEWEN